MVKVNYKSVLDRLFQTWVVCYGALTILVVSGYFLSHVWLPLVGFMAMLCIKVFGTYNIRRWSINCSLMTHYTVYILGVSSIIMLVANILNTNFITNKFSEFSKQDYPFHASFIVYPVAAVLFMIAIWRRNKTEYCKACKNVALYSTSETLRHNLLNAESKFEVHLAFWISLVMSVITYSYYYVYYRDGSFERLYSPDIFFMYGFPAATYLISVAYCFTRYSGMDFEVSLVGSAEENKRHTLLRYIVVCDDQLLLKEKVIDEVGYARWDTPAEETIDYIDDVPDQMARDRFTELSGLHDFAMRRLYATNTRHTTVVHYAVFIPVDDIDKCSLGGEWLTLHDLDQMLASGVVARSFALEMHRVHTITMAWKTYDREGHRLYPIKNYRPTFRLRDFRKWDVDYEDLHWINVAKNNQDKPFYNLRHFWRRYVSGIEKKWNKRNS